MATYGEVIQAITRRLNRDDLDQIAREFAVDRIDYFKKNCFYQWRITDASIITVAGVSLYNFPAGFEQVTDISLLVGSWRTIDPITYAEMMEMDVVEPPVQGVPNYWAPIGPQFRLFPAPGTAYPLQLTMDLPQGPPAENASNFWTLDARTLIIEATIAEICDSYLNDPVRAARHGKLADREELALGTKTMRLRGGIQVRGWF